MRLFRIVSIIAHDSASFPLVWTYWLGQGRPGRGSAGECWVLWAQQSGLKEHSNGQDAAHGHWGAKAGGGSQTAVTLSLLVNLKVRPPRWNRTVQ